jgi:LmbE family N-acetylglucosaminyl deacetylase
MEQHSRNSISSTQSEQGSRRTPRATALGAATAWIRKRRDARIRADAEAANQVLERLVARGITGEDMGSVVVVVAHPDDEAIGAGAVLRGVPNVTIVHVTDGAPADDEYARAKGFESRDAYARARRRETVAALGVIGITEDRIRGLGVTDGEAAWRMVDTCHAIRDVLDELSPDIVLTHPYEGGHSDHDSTALAVHLAVGIIQRDEGRAPVILELTSYHNYNGRRRRFSFLPAPGTRVRTRVLSLADRQVKRKVFEAFRSQHAVLQSFPIEVERFRQAPRYLFTVPPHEGQLDYERLCRRMTGAEWRAQAERALQLLRSKEQFRGM